MKLWDKVEPLATSHWHNRLGEKIKIEVLHFDTEGIVAAAVNSRAVRYGRREGGAIVTRLGRALVMRVTVTKPEGDSD